MSMAGRFIQTGVVSQTGVISQTQCVTMAPPPPVQALLLENGDYTCGAIVLSGQWILTAAHCVWGKPVTVFQVIVGTATISSSLM